MAGAGSRPVRRCAACFPDRRDARYVEHRVETLVGQRIFGLALGYEDLNDHDELRRDPLLAVLAEKPHPTGKSRARERDRGQALAGKSTLNRLELTTAVVKKEERYKKISLEMEAVDRLLVGIFLQAHQTPPAEVVLDLDDFGDIFGGEFGRERVEGFADDKGADGARSVRGDLLSGGERFEAGVVPLALAKFSDDEDFHVRSPSLRTSVSRRA